MCFRPTEIQMKTCPECGTKNTPVATVCKECGAELPEVKVDRAAQQAQFMAEANAAGAAASAPKPPVTPNAPQAPGAPKSPSAQ